MKEERRAYQWLAVALLVGNVAWIVYVVRSDFRDSLGAGQPDSVATQVDMTLHSGATSGDVGGTPPHPAASALSALPEEETISLSGTSAEEHLLSASKSMALASTILDLEVSFQPTVEGLYARTAELWTNPDFLTLDDDRARELLGLEGLVEASGWTMPGTLQEYVGGDLPTHLDCQVALEDDEAKRLLEALCVEEAVYTSLCETPLVDRTRTKRAIIERMRLRRDAAEDELMRRLDRVTTYKSWLLLARMCREWGRKQEDR